MLRYSADIELKLAAAIEREESSVTFGLSSFSVQINKSVYSLSVVAPEKEVSFALVVSYIF